MMNARHKPETHIFWLAWLVACSGDIAVSGTPSFTGVFFRGKLAARRNARHPMQRCRKRRHEALPISRYLHVLITGVARKRQQRQFKATLRQLFPLAKREREKN